MPVYTYTYNAKIELTNSQGTMEHIISSAGANGKFLFDDTIPVSADFNLEPHLATIEAPSIIFIRFSDPSGYKLALDGDVLNASSNVFTESIFLFGTPGAAPVIHLVTTAPGRLEIFALGDPV